MYHEVMNPAGYRAGLYIRLSKEDENQSESLSIANQRSLLMAYAKEHQLEVGGEYIDDGYSGTTFDRPGFLRMLTDIEDKKINMVITKDMSRLGRDYIQTGYYLEKYFPESNVRYISLLDGVDTGVDSITNEITPFRAIMNDMYAKDISKKIKSVKQDQQRRGLFVGGKASYGYRLSELQNNTIIVDEAAAEIVRMIFQMADQGVTCRQIAILLNEQGIKSPAAYAGFRSEGRWSPERIAFMLKNQVYLGHMVQGRVKKVNYKSKKIQRLPQEAWNIVENTHEPIIEQAQFDRVQKQLASRSRTRIRTYDYLLKGLIYCHECGCPLGIIKRTLSGGREVFYYVCRTYQRDTKSGSCAGHIVREDAVTEAVTESVRTMCQQYIDEKKAGEWLQNIMLQKEKKGNGPPKKKELENLSIQIDQIYHDYISGMLEREDFERLYEKMKKRRALLEEEKSTDKSIAADQWLPRFLEAASTNRALLVGLIARIELTQDKKIIIRYRFRQ